MSAAELSQNDKQFLKQFVSFHLHSPLVSENSEKEDCAFETLHNIWKALAYKEDHPDQEWQDLLVTTEIVDGITHSHKLFELCEFDPEPQPDAGGERTLWTLSFFGDKQEIERDTAASIMKIIQPVCNGFYHKDKPETQFTVFACTARTEYKTIKDSLLFTSQQ